MQLYNKLIENLAEYLKELPRQSSNYSKDLVWPRADNYQLVLQKDTAFELGADNFESINGTYITDDEELYAKLMGENESKVLLYGEDLCNIKDNASYGRISLILINKDDKWENDTDSLYTMLGDLDFVKYHIHPLGFMVRTSSQNQREQVRISKDALNKGISFEKVGNLFIQQYLEKPNVKKASVIFITNREMNYNSLTTDVNKAVEIRNSLAKIRKGIPTECSVCEIKEICDDVKGLKELHFGKKKMQK